MYKQDFAFNNVQGLLCYKAQVTIYQSIYIYIYIYIEKDCEASRGVWLCMQGVRELISFGFDDVITFGMLSYDQ